MQLGGGGGIRKELSEIFFNVLPMNRLHMRRQIDSGSVARIITNGYNYLLYSSKIPFPNIHDSRQLFNIGIAILAVT